MKILANDEIDKELWNRFAEYKIFYRYEWLYVIKDSYGLEPLFILCYRGDKFALIASFKTNKGYISLPFVSYSGFLSNSDRMLEELKKYLEKNSITIDSRDLLDQDVKEGYVNPIVTIPSFDDFWNNVSRNTRNQFRKAQKNTFIFKEDSDLRNFYKLYSLGMRNLGTPVHGKNFFYNLIRYFNTHIFTIFDENEPIGSMFSIGDTDTLSILYAYVLPQYSKQYANYFLYLNVVKWIAKNGIVYMDMGRSTYGVGTYHFKKKFKPKFYAINSKINYSSSAKMKIASNIWKKLPLPVANILGPKIRKFLP